VNVVAIVSSIVNKLPLSFSELTSCITFVITLGVLVVIVLAIGPKVLGFKSDRGRWISKGNKNSLHDFFGGEFTLDTMSEDFTTC
jgi:hypothetical protein